MTLKSHQLLIACYFESRGDAWLGYALDYSLVAQGSSLEEAKHKLTSQVFEYIYDATVGEDCEHAAVLLRRRAPARFWFKFYWTYFRQWLKHATQVSLRRRAERAPIPLAPVCV